MNHFLVLGSHPFLSLAEAKAVIGGPRPTVIGSLAFFHEETWDGALLQERLAGVVKLGDVILDVPVNDLTPEALADALEKYPRKNQPETGRIEFGLTMFSAPTTLKNLPIKLKQILKQRGHAVRWVTGESGDVSPAAVAKAGLIDKGYDIVIGVTHRRAIVGLTTHVQDADAWGLRDFGRPVRDMNVGILPPKLARMMINLASSDPSSLLDPFCGGGSILMEALLMGFTQVIGSDIAQEQINGATTNLQWIADKHLVKKDALKSVQLFASPAQKINAQIKGPIQSIVTEGYLGRLLSGQETKETLEKQKRDIEGIWTQALPILAKLQPVGGRLVCVWPVFVSSHGTVAVDLKQDVESFGYKMIDPLQGWTDKPITLTYARADQRVKRNIVVLERTRF